MCGVYYLWDGATVIYVGASRNIQARIAGHVATKQIDFAGYFVDRYRACNLAEREAAAIREFKPYYNVIGVGVDMTADV